MGERVEDTLARQLRGAFSKGHSRGDISEEPDVPQRGNSRCKPSPFSK